MLHQHLIILGSLGHGLPWGAGLDFVVVRGAAFVGEVGVKPLCPLITTGVPSSVLLIAEVGLIGMITTMIDLSTQKLFVATRALELLKTSEHLPEDVLPRNLLLPQKHDEFIDIPMLITLMLGDRIAVIVHK